MLFHSFEKGTGCSRPSTKGYRGSGLIVCTGTEIHSVPTGEYYPVWDLSKPWVTLKVLRTWKDSYLFNGINFDGFLVKDGCVVTPFGESGCECEDEAVQARLGSAGEAGRHSCVSIRESGA